MKDKKDISVEISPKNPDSKWVALDNHNQIISEGINPDKVVAEAQKKSEDFYMMFVPKEGNTYIF